MLSSSDLKLALRSLLKSPAFTAIAVITLAFTIGLNTAVFSVVDAVVFRPLPFPEPERLVALCELNRGERLQWCGSSVPDVYEVAERSRTIAVAGVARSWPFMLKTSDGAEGVNGGLATPGAFAALGVKPLLGRLIETGDLGTHWQRVVVLSHETWQTRFGGQREILGRMITLSDEPHTIVGVLPPGTRLPFLEDVQFWRPIHFDPRAEERRDWRGFLPFARLRDGVTLEQVRGEVAAIAADIQRTHFAGKPGWSIRVVEWQDVVVGPVRGSMYIFAGAVGLVLLIGCANVANLLLARATSRDRELAVRAALGASRAQLIRWVFGESLVLAVLGGAAGLLLGAFASKAFVALAPRGIPRIDQVTLDSRVLLFTAATAVLVTLLVGTIPALRATRADPSRALAEGGRGGTGRRGHRVGASLIVLEIALAVILVTGAGLLTRSFGTLLRWQPGFEQEHLLTTWTFSSPGRFANRRAVADQIARAEEALGSIPSVVSVGAGSAGPLFGGDGAMGFTIDNQPAPTDGAQQTALWYDVSPGYFRTLGLPIVRGRDIEERDAIGAPLVGVINETFARRFFTGDPLGHSVHMIEHDATFVVIGIVRDVPPIRPGEEVPAQIWWSNRQIPRPATYYLVRTTSDDRGELARAIRGRLKQIDPEMQITEVLSVRDWLSYELVRPRFALVLLGTFGTLAVLLAAFGTYGLVTYTVTQHTKEVGIRVALGAQPAKIVAGIVLRGIRLAALAILIGSAGAFALTRLLTGLLAGVSPTDPLSFSISIVLLLVAVALACAVPARRASKVDPMIAIRTE